MKKRLSIAFLFLPVALALATIAAYGETKAQVIGPFGTLNNTDNSYTIPANRSPDLLNVDLSPGGKSAKKRSGYGTAFTLSNSTSQIKYIYNFFNSAGSSVDLYFNDTNMEASISGATPSVVFSTGPNGATYQCIDTAGEAFCANDSRTSIINTDGTTATTITNVLSTGTLLAVTPERLVHAGFDEDPSRIDFSHANDFSTWTLGGDPEDPISFTIVSPGAYVTHITYAHGRVYWFKTSSFGYILEGPTHGDWVVRTLNSNVGTLFNTSIFRDDILYFQGDDGHFYGWDGSSLKKLSRDIQESINVTQGRIANSWEQTTQSDFESGLSTPTNRLSYTINSGDIILGSHTVTYTSNADFSTGILSDVRLKDGSVYIATTSISLVNGNFENITDFVPDDWTKGTGNSPGATTGSVVGNNCTVTAQGGSGYAFDSGDESEMYVRIVDDDTTILSNTIISWSANNCSWTQKTVSAGSYIGRRVRVEIARNITQGSSGKLYTTDTFILGGDVTFYHASDSVGGSVTKYNFFDTFSTGRSTITAGTWTSPTINTGVSQATVTVSVDVTSNTFTIGHTFQDSTDGSSWSNLSNSTATGFTTNQYIRYIASFTVTGSPQDALTSLDTFSLTARAPSATFYSQINSVPDLTSWDVFEANRSLNNGTLNLFLRASTNTYSIASSTPVWTAVTAGGIPTASTGTNIQVKAEFTITNATQNPTLNDFTVNWFEGSATDKTHAIYHDDALWWAVASGAGASSNNKILKLDLINEGWLLYDIPMNGMLVRSQNLYFGDPTAGRIFRFGSSDSDNGSAIEAYWKSRDFFGDNPFVDKHFNRLSFATKGNSNSNMDVTYEVNGSTATSFQVPVYNSSSDAFVKRNVFFPSGTSGSVINFKFGNNAADQPFELFGGVLEYEDKPWFPEP